MQFKILTIVLILLAVRAWGAVIPAKERHQTPREYHPNMTSIWMTDEYGQVVEVYLTGRPLHGHRPLAGVEDHVFFFLYTKEYNSAYKLTKNDVDKLKSSTFKGSRPTKILIHGFWNSYQSDAVQTIREAYLNVEDVNVVGVDWSSLSAGPWYSEAVSHTEAVGQEVAQFLEFLVQWGGARVADLHLIGHSLGAHVAGFASNHVTSGRILRITGLDPALPLFKNRPPESRLNPSDAELVDCIHTCGGTLGFFDPICSIDFYPNGGKATQPGCRWDFTGACSHGRSFRYYSASVLTNFTAKGCGSLDDVSHRRCSGSLGLMGDKAPSSKPGLYYLETIGEYPYAL